MDRWLFAALDLAIAIATWDCARRTQPDRTYWPMQRVVWSTLAAIYLGAGAAAALGSAGNPGGRLAFTLTMLGAVGYARWFIHKRNKTPRFVGLDVAGHPEVRTTEELRAATLLAISYLRHGAMAPDQVAALEEALPRWHELDDWKGRFGGEVRARRAARGE